MARKNNKLGGRLVPGSESQSGKRRGPKKKPPRPQQLEEFRAALDLSRQYREDLLKEIRISYEQLPDNEGGRARAKREEFLQVEQSVYHYWWQFVQSGIRFPSPDRDPKTNTEISRTLSAFRDLDLPFEAWWEQIGRRLFAERANLPLITVEAMDEAFDVKDPKQFPKHITVKIPLTIPEAGIRDQLSKILAVCHPGNALKVHESSTAEIKIYSKTDVQIAKLAKYLRVWTAVEQEKEKQPDPALRLEYWEIGRGLGMAAGLDLTGRNSDAAINRTNLQTEIRTIYEKANRLVSNALRGEFPKK